MGYQLRPLKSLLHVSAIPTILYYSFTPDYRSAWDVHDFWELIFVDQGMAIIQTEERSFPLNCGQVILHRPNLRHRIQCDGKHAAQVFIISFVCRSAAMNGFGTEPISLPDSIRPQITALLEDSMTTFDCHSWIIPLDSAPIGGQQIVRNQLEMLLIRLLRISKQQEEANADRPRPVSDHQLSDHIMIYLRDHLCEPITIDGLCHIFHYRKSRLCALFKEQTGKTIIGYLTECKIEEAKRLMREGRSVGQIASLLHFDTPQYFSRVFKKYTGLSPRAYQSSLMFDVNSHVKKRQLNVKKLQGN